MIGFIGTSITITLNYNHLQQLTINDCLRLAPFLSELRASSTVTDLVLIYESVTSSVSVFRCLTLHSWTLSHDCNLTQLESESELLYDWRFTANQFVLATSPLRLTTNTFIFQLNICGYSPYATSSLTRGWVCRLQLLLGLASAVINRSESRGTHDNILLSQIRDSPNLEYQVPVFIFPRNRVARLYPPALGSIFIVSYDS
jgi:hypothetical protein